MPSITFRSACSKCAIAGAGGLAATEQDFDLPCCILQVAGPDGRSQSLDAVCPALGRGEVAAGNGCLNDLCFTGEAAVKIAQDLLVESSLAHHPFQAVGLVDAGEFREPIGTGHASDL